MKNIFEGGLKAMLSVIPLGTLKEVVNSIEEDEKNKPKENGQATLKISPDDFDKAKFRYEIWHEGHMSYCPAESYVTEAEARTAGELAIQQERHLNDNWERSAYNAAEKDLKEAQEKTNAARVSATKKRILAIERRNSAEAMKAKPNATPEETAKAAELLGDAEKIELEAKTEIDKAEAMEKDAKDKLLANTTDCPDCAEVLKDPKVLTGAYMSDITETRELVKDGVRHLEVLPEEQESGGWQTYCGNSMKAKLNVMKEAADKKAAELKAAEDAKLKKAEEEKQNTLKKATEEKENSARKIREERFNKLRELANERNLPEDAPSAGVVTADDKEAAGRSRYGSGS